MTNARSSLVGFLIAAVLTQRKTDQVLHHDDAPAPDALVEDEVAECTYETALRRSFSSLELRK